MSELPQSWGESELEKLLSFVIGGDWGKTPDYIDENFVDVLCIRGTEFRNWQKDKGSTASHRRIKSASLEKRSLKLGDILIEISGGGPDQPVGRTVLIDADVLEYKPETPKVGTNFLRLARPISLMSPSYLNYYLLNFYMSGEVIKYQGGSNNLRNLKFKDYSKITIPIAPLNEQIRIANKLDSLLGKLEATQKHLDKIPTLLKRFRQSVLAAAVSGELTKEWRLKKGLGLKLQEEKLVNIVSNIQIGPFGSLLHKSDYIVGEIPIINPMHIISGKITPSQNMTISSEKHGELKRYHLKEGDVILGRRGEMGRAAVITKKQEGWLCGTGSLFLRFDHEIINPNFLWLVMTSPSTIEKLVKGSVGSTMVNLNQKILKSLEINFPKIEEQKQIVHQVESLFNLADKVEQQYQVAKQRTDKLTQSILAKAFRGELVPQEPNDEPASELLKRIQLNKA